MIGSVPIYDTLTRTGKETCDLTIDDWFKTVEIHGENGIDFVTIHAGLNLKAAETIRKNPRLCGIVSRGGSILYEWMAKTGTENPFYEHYDRLLDQLGMARGADAAYQRDAPNLPIPLAREHDARGWHIEQAALGPPANACLCLLLHV